MKKRFDEYTRLARGLFGVSSLWLGPNDLLYVRGTGVLMPFAEEYVRFELGRIRSAAMVNTRTGLVLNIVYGTLALISGVPGAIAVWQLVSGVDDDIEIVLYILATPLLLLAAVAMVLFFINFALGPTCHFQIQTATRIERLRPVRRVRVARRVLARLMPA